MAKIQQLSPHLADLIAAGEVVERPASCAKELVENSIDAGATQITVEIRDGGMTYLRVTDNGCGIAAEDLETAFLRHATSKLKTAQDLEAIGTLGFRGEALAAISAVSRMDVMTKTEAEDLGVSLHLEAGTVTERTEAGCPTGTTMIVRDLFFNTPARMKFMKSDSTEASALLSSMQRLALAHPEISFRVIRDGQTQLHTAGDSSLYSAIYTVLGKDTAKAMIPVESHWNKYSLSGYVSKASATRGNRSIQIFFVNGRLVRSKSMTVALEEAYRNRMMVGRFPYCVLHLKMPEHLVDVNVHPAKVEVKFLNERDVFDTLHYGIAGALDRAEDRPELRLPKTEAPKEPQPTRSATMEFRSGSGQFFRNMTAEEYRQFDRLVSKTPAVTPSKTVEQQLFSPKREAVPTPLPKVPPVAEPPKTPIKPEILPTPEPIPTPLEIKLPEPPVQVPLPPVDVPSVQLVPQEAPPAEETPTQFLPPETEEPQYRIVGQVLNTYIIVEQGHTLLFIDKHAAHERILFEQLKQNTQPIMSQMLLTPLLLSPEREEGAVLLEQEVALQELGFALSDYGDGTLAVSRIPSDISPEDVEATLNALARDLLAGKRLEPGLLRDKLLHTMACKAAIKGGRYSDPAELEVLVKQILSRDDLKHCPHGRPICIQMSSSQLERQFKR
ncbi:MAG: DNA mismatch repair endonuclease MutL [Oscillospiraceae bacterium]|nr:DNA mismatch repair endonuclease MutL [Oscillospiraceae bacterium]